MAGVNNSGTRLIGHGRCRRGNVRLGDLQVFDTDGAAVRLNGTEKTVSLKVTNAVHTAYGKARSVEVATELGADADGSPFVKSCGAVMPRRVVADVIKNYVSCKLEIQALAVIVARGVEVDKISQLSGGLDDLGVSLSSRTRCKACRNTAVPDVIG